MTTEFTKIKGNNTLKYIYLFIYLFIWLHWVLVAGSLLMCVCVSLTLL